MAQKEPAENQLLKMIETPNGPSGGKKGGGKKGRGRAKRAKKPASALAGIKFLNFLLVLGILAAGYVLFANVSEGLKLLDSRIAFQVDSHIADDTGDLMPTVDSFASYAETMNQRNIFKPVEKDAPVTVQKPSESQRNADRLQKRFELVGVSWFEVPESASVMIEDTESGITYFLQEGEQFEGLTVKTIYADRAILSYQDEEITIKL